MASAGARAWARARECPPIHRKLISGEYVVVLSSVATSSGL